MRVSTALILYLLIQVAIWGTGFKPVETWLIQMSSFREWASE